MRTIYELLFFLTINLIKKIEVRGGCKQQISSKIEESPILSLLIPVNASKISSSTETVQDKHQLMGQQLNYYLCSIEIVCLFGVGFKRIYYYHRIICGLTRFSLLWKNAWDNHLKEEGSIWAHIFKCAIHSQLGPLIPSLWETEYMARMWWNRPAHFLAAGKKKEPEKSWEK